MPTPAICRDRALSCRAAGGISRCRRCRPAICPSRRRSRNNNRACRTACIKRPDARRRRRSFSVQNARVPFLSLVIRRRPLRIEALQMWASLSFGAFSAAANERHLRRHDRHELDIRVAPATPIPNQSAASAPWACRPSSCFTSRRNRRRASPPSAKNGRRASAEAHDDIADLDDDRPRSATRFLPCSNWEQ